MDSGEWYCPGCGARYDEAGECTNGHDPIALLALSDTAAADDGTTAPGIPASPDDGPAATEPEPAAAPAPDTTPTGDAAAVSPDETTDAGGIPVPPEPAGDSAPADAAPPVATPDALAGVNSIVAEAQTLLARARDALASLGG